LDTTQYTTVVPRCPSSFPTTDTTAWYPRVHSVTTRLDHRDPRTQLANNNDNPKKRSIENR
jgi:hypothetical protein